VTSSNCTFSGEKWERHKHPAFKGITPIDTKDFVLLKKTTYIYAQGKESVTVVFKDDKVQSTTSTLSE